MPTLDLFLSGNKDKLQSKMDVSKEEILEQADNLEGNISPGPDGIQHRVSEGT